MRILVLFPYAPQPPPLDLAGTKRNLPFLLELTKYNKVSVLSYGDRLQWTRFISHYGAYCETVRFVPRNRPRVLTGLQRVWLLVTGRSPFRQLYSKEMQGAIDAFVRDCEFDIIHCCVQMFGYFRFPETLPVTSDCHEVKYDLFYRTARMTRSPFLKILYYWYYKTSKKEEVSLCRRFRLLVTTTERDKCIFQEQLPGRRISAVSNGAPEAFFESVPCDVEAFTMVFTGLFTHLPNSDGIVYFIDRILPLVLKEVPAAKTYVVGQNPTRAIRVRSSRSVIVTGFVDDVRPYIARSEVFVIPLLAGGGIRGKALEAMAMRKPIVTTSIGVEGIDLRHSESAIFGDTPQDFAQGILRLFREPELGRRISENAFRIARSFYSWESKGKELNRLLRSVVADGKAPRVSRG